MRFKYALIILDFKDQFTSPSSDQLSKHKKMELIHKFEKWFLSKKKKKILINYLRSLECRKIFIIIKNPWVSNG